MIVDTFGLAFLDLGGATVAVVLLAGVMASYDGRLSNRRIERLLRTATMGVAMMLTGGVLLLSGVRP